MSEGERLEQIKVNNKHSYCDKNDVDFLLNLIEKQNKEIEHLENLNKHQSKDLTKAVGYTFELNKELEIKDKMIDEMAEHIDFEKMNFDCSPLCVRPNCEISCIKEYFRKKAENG